MKIEKKGAYEEIDRNSELLKEVSLFFHSHPEIAYEEYELSQYLVDQLRKLGCERWFSLNNYGMSWPGTEGIFSAMKRKFGENTFKIRGGSAGRELREILGI
ncbi:MAG: hypothetical protein QXW39_05170 [Candidatus Bathyarchaeia archaeon]